MKFTYETITLRDVCLSAKKAKKIYGVKVTLKLHQKLKDIEAADSLIDLPAKTVKSADEIGPECLFVSLSDGYILKFKPGQLNIPLDASGVLILAEIYRIKLLAIEKENA